MFTNVVFDIIVATCSKTNHTIGNKNNLPWPFIKEDMDHFKQITVKAKKNKRNAVIMGRKTWESIPKKFRPLRDRLNIILTRNKDYEINENKNCMLFHDFNEALNYIGTQNDVDNIYIIGGATLYSKAINDKRLRYAYITIIEDIFYGDTHCNELGKFSNKDNYLLLEEKQVKVNNLKNYIKFNKYQTINHDEVEYQYLIRKILNKGTYRDDRTGTGTLSLFAPPQLRFNLETHFPLLTTKRVFWRGIKYYLENFSFNFLLLLGVVGELLWFLKGSTNAKQLQEKNIHIWDGNSSREFLDNLGFKDREEGDLGAIYGFQWRHFGAEYQDCHTDYKDQGIDQIKQVIKSIKEDPYSRRHLVSAWNPKDSGKMNLQPCHALFQFYVDPLKKHLSCQMYQRSMNLFFIFLLKITTIGADMFLGVPFNIASYALLTCMIAQVCDLTPKELIIVFGDCHIYQNHIEQCKVQLEREPRVFPTLNLNKNIKDIDNFKETDIHLNYYSPFPRIKAEMAI